MACGMQLTAVAKYCYGLFHPVTLIDHTNKSLCPFGKLTNHASSQGRAGVCSWHRATCPPGLKTHHAPTTNAFPQPKPRHISQPFQNPTKTTWESAISSLSQLGGVQGGCGGLQQGAEAPRPLRSIGELAWCSLQHLHGSV